MYATLNRLPAHVHTLLFALVACMAPSPHSAVAAGRKTASVETPLQATLLPEVTITASADAPDATRPQVADTQPLTVTLMPAVRVVVDPMPTSATARMSQRLASTGSLACCTGHLAGMDTVGVPSC